MAQKLTTGMTVRQGSLVWTTLRSKQSQLEIVENRTVSLDLPPGPIDYAAADLAGRIKNACGGLKGRLALAIPTEHALMRVVELPSKEPEELRSMVELQVDKFSPFPISQMVVSFEQLQSHDGSSRVLVVATQRELVEKFGGAFRLAGLRPHEMDVEVLGWWQLLKDSGQVPEKGRQVLLLVDITSVELIVTQDGIPVLFRSLGTRTGGIDAELSREIAEETSYTLTTLEADLGQVESVRLTIWHWDALPPELPVQLQQECGVEVETFGLNTLPPISEGLARRSAQRGPLSLDLAPEDWRVTEVSRQAKMRLLLASAIFLGLWLLAISGFMGGLTYQQNKLKRMKVKVEQVEKPAEEVRKIKQKVEDLDQYADRTRSSIECLREISTILPPGLDLTSFVYKKAGEVNLRGQTTPDNVNLIYTFFEALEKSPLFVAIDNQKVTTNPSGGRQSTQFTVTARLVEEKKT